MKNKIFTSLCISILILFVLFSCDPAGGDPTPGTPGSTGTPGTTPDSEPGGPFFSESFDGAEDGQNIRNNQTGLDCPDSFSNSTISGTVTAGTTTAGPGAITINNNRMAFTVPGLSDSTEPVLYVTIKNDNESGTAVDGLSLAVGDTYTTSGSLGSTGRLAHGLYPVTSTSYEILTITLNTNFIGTDMIQFRGYVGSSSTAGLHIDKIEIAEFGYTPGPAPTPGPTPIPTLTPISTPTPIPTPLLPPGTIDPECIGFATLNGGTTGGSSAIETNDTANIVSVSTGTGLQDAIDNRVARDTPRVIYVNGTITRANSPDDKINVKGNADDELVENISIIGIGASGELDGIGIKIWRTRNIIIQNLKIHHVNIGDKDCISIEGPASNIWVDHCELYNAYDGVDRDYYDGLIDVKRESEYFTISWNYFHDSWKASLVGSSDSDNFDRKITYHHNYFYYSNSRLPSYRHGQGHVFNNYYDTVFTGGVNTRIGATLRIEGNYFKDVQDPICSKDSPQGFWDLGPGTDIDSNVYENCTWGTTPETEYTNASILGFDDTVTYEPPYTYTLQSATDARDDVLTNCGVGKIIDP